MSRVSVRTKEKRFPVAKDLYGLFFEDISHAGDGGLYPEMIRNMFMTCCCRRPEHHGTIPIQLLPCP